MNNVFLTVLNMSVAATFVIAALCFARLALQKIRAPRWISYALWAVAGFRLAVPFSFESILSLMPIKSAPIPINLSSMEHAEVISSINSGSAVFDGAIETMLTLTYAKTSVPGNPYSAITKVVSYVWLFGVVAMLLYAIISYMRLIRRIDSVTTPCAYGFIKPKIHIPNGLEGEKLRYVMLHEQTHIKRHDHIVKMFAFALLCVHWFNPLAWIAFVLLCADMEMSCDERVLSELGTSVKADYSQTLLSLSTKHRVLNASPLAFGEGGIKGRIKNVLKFKKSSRIVTIAAVVLAFLLTVGLTLNRVAANNMPDSHIQATISYEGKSAVIALDNKDSIPYVELGSTISLNFADSRPESVNVIEVRANADGSRKYNEFTDRTLEVELSGSNLATFTVESDWIDGSNSEDYLPGNSFRWYRIICGDSENSAEYGLWLRTDPAITMNIAPIPEINPEGDVIVAVPEISPEEDVIVAVPEISPEEQHVKALWVDDYDAGVRVSFPFDDNKLNPHVGRIVSESIPDEPTVEITQDEINRPPLLYISVDGKGMMLVVENINKITVTHTVSGQTERFGLRDEQAVETLAGWIRTLKLERCDFPVGQTPGDSDGGEIWSFDINGIDAFFTYGNYGGGDCYIIYGDEWYKVQNPSEPVIN